MSGRASEKKGKKGQGWSRLSFTWKKKGRAGGKTRTLCWAWEGKKIGPGRRLLVGERGKISFSSAEKEAKAASLPAVKGGKGGRGGSKEERGSFYLEEGGKGEGRGSKRYVLSSYGKGGRERFLFPIGWGGGKRGRGFEKGGGGKKSVIRHGSEEKGGKKKWCRRRVFLAPDRGGEGKRQIFRLNVTPGERKGGKRFGKTNLRASMGGKKRREM